MLTLYISPAAPLSQQKSAYVAAGAPSRPLAHVTDTPESTTFDTLLKRDLERGGAAGEKRGRGLAYSDGARRVARRMHAEGARFGNGGTEGASSAARIAIARPWSSIRRLFKGIRQLVRGEGLDGEADGDELGAD